MSGDAALDIDTLSFAWPGQAPCLSIERFTLAARERLFLQGPSGSGKSTLLSLVGGVIVPTAGRLRVLGTDTAALRPSARDRFRADRLGIVFQLFNLLPYLSALDNITLACRFSRARRERAGDVAAEARRLAARLDLDPSLLVRPAVELSVGQQQRVAAARALIGRPSLVIADEPTSALDAERQAGFVDLLLGECRASGSALLFVSHDRSLAGRFDRCVRLPDINRPEGAR
ncbi:MAG: ATP-binding cassette domain-containing protein [Rhodocyclaceae bacterium]|nr:ATP-binding cassette domain-containing protein [Rhodocyclaceae bacterium]